MLTDQQIEERLDAITGSDAAVILGLSPWKTPLDLWREKMRLIAPQDISDRKAVIRGNYLENAVATWWADNTGKQVEEDKTFLRHKDHPWMRGNIDRRVIGERAILECKTARNGFGWDQEANQVPMYYLIQLAHYVAVDDAERGYIACFIGSDDKFMHFTYERNEKLEEKMIAKLGHFWEYNILQQIAPDPVNLQDVLSLYGPVVKAKDIQVPLNDDGAFEGMVATLAKVKEQMGYLKKQEKELKDKVAVYMGVNTRLISSDGIPLVTWNSTKPFDSFDSNWFKKENPELYKQYCKTKVERRMLIK